jgi:predicted patatin/cPLA2 family phospholipase
MKHINLFEEQVSLITEKKKGKKWIQKAIKTPGALKKHFGIEKDETIPMEKINSEIEKLHKKKEGGEKLSKEESKLLRRLNLAKTLKTKKW